MLLLEFMIQVVLRFISALAFQLLQQFFGQLIRLCADLTPDGTKSEWRDATGTILLVEVSLHKEWYGESILLIEKNTNARVAFITRLGEAVLPDEHTVLQEGDLVHLLVNEKQVAETEKMLAKSPAGA
jgi:trk system potassium uptake protein